MSGPHKDELMIAGAMLAMTAVSWPTTYNVQNTSGYRSPRIRHRGNKYAASRSIEATKHTAMLPGVARNKPCPCGCGRKAKRCAKVAASPSAIGGTRSERVQALAQNGGASC